MLFFLPVRVGRSRSEEAIPIVNAALIGINIVAFLFPKVIMRSSNVFFSTITYSFVHATFWHLLINMWVLWVFGNRVNVRLGSLWYAIVYLGTVVVIGVLLQVLLRVNLVGASGAAIFAVVAVCTILMPRALIEILCIALVPLSLLLALFDRPKHWAYWFVRWGRLRIRALWGLFIVPVLEIVGLLWWGWNWTNVGHMFGLLCGVGAVLILPQRISMGQIQRPGHVSMNWIKKGNTANLRV